MLDEIIHLINSYTGFLCIDTECFESEGDFFIPFTFKEFHYYMTILYPNDPTTRQIKVSMKDDKGLLSYPHIFLQNNTRINVEGENLFYLCLVNKEEHIFSSMSIAEHVNLYMEQLERLMNLTQTQIDTEFQKEFLNYWNQTVTQKIWVDIYISNKREVCEVECLHVRNIAPDIQRILIKEPFMHINSTYTESGTMEKGLFIPIADSVGIVPPTKQNAWNNGTILDIIINQKRDRISPQDYEFLKKLFIRGKHKYVVFSMKIPNGMEITFLALIKFANSEKKLFIEKIREDLLDIEPIFCERSDVDYMIKRIGGEDAFLDKKILIIGAGSVGSYLISEIVKIGIMNISISDKDELSTGNIMRHRLGKNYILTNKAIAMKMELEKMYPQAKISTYNDLFDKKGTSGSEFYNKFDLIILAIGSTDAQRRYNKFFKLHKINVPVIYNWLDAEGKGCHLLYIDYKHKGCFECLFREKGVPLGINKASFASGGEALLAEGCGGSFTPYGNEVLLKNTYIAMELVSKALKGELNENILVSSRNNFQSLSSAINFDATISTNFYEESCEICGNI
jgi:molybdopterin/thiamine biosynthesis adenylyltransferase